MKRILLLSLLIFSAGAHTVVYAGLPRHVDPERLSLRSPEPFPLFELYSQVYGFIASGDYATAEEMLSLFQEIASPPSTGKTLEGYNQLLEEIIDDLNVTERYLKLAYQHLKWLRDPQAEQALRLAEQILLDANGTTLSLETASRGIASILKGSPDRLLEGVSNLTAVIDSLQLELLEGLDEVEKIRLLRDLGAQQTFLILKADNERPYLGDTVTFSGALTLVDGSGLASKAVEIVVDGAVAATVETGLDGSYLCRLSIPYRYVDTMKVYTQYFPEPEDNHLPAASETITLNPVYYHSTLVLDGPETVYPGKSFTVKGRISFLQQPLRDRILTVRYLGSSQTTGSDENGEYTFTLHTLGDASEGTGKITVVSAPRGLYDSATSTITVNIIRETVELDVDNPTIVLAGRTGVVSGTVTSGGASLPGCLVQIELSEHTVMTETDASGRFTSSFTYPLTKLSSRLEYRVIAIPPDPWFSQGIYRNSFYLLNLIPISGIVFILGLFAISRRRPTPPPMVSDIALPPASQPTVYNELPGPPGLYVKAVKLIGRVAGEELRPSYTIRNYLARVRPRLGQAAYKLFQRISRQYESWAYGREKSRPPMKILEKLLNRLREETG